MTTSGGEIPSNLAEQVGVGQSALVRLEARKRLFDVLLGLPKSFTAIWCGRLGNTVAKSKSSGSFRLVQTAPATTTPPHHLSTPIVALRGPTSSIPISREVPKIQSGLRNTVGDRTDRLLPYQHSSSHSLSQYSSEHSSTSFSNSPSQSKASSPESSSSDGYWSRSHSGHPIEPEQYRSG